MIRPDDVPDDVWQKAVDWLTIPEADRVGNTLGYFLAPYEIKGCTIIARAILAERERCAKVAETAGPQHYYNQHGQERGVSEIEGFIARSIRNPEVRK